MSPLDKSNTSLSGVEYVTSVIELSGALTYKTVPSAWRETLPFFGNYPLIQMDLKYVTQSDNSAVALMIEWVRKARSINNQKIIFQNIPQQLTKLIKTSQLDQLLYQEIK